MKRLIGIFIAAVLATSVSGCNREAASERNINQNKAEEYTMADTNESIIQLEDGLSLVSFMGEYGFDKFMEQGGAASDREVIDFIKNNVITNADISFGGNTFGCSTIAAQSADGDKLFGRNFDWNNCEALIVKSRPTEGYSSISTVNMDFIRQGGGLSVNSLPDNIKTMAALYAPLDGMNEKGLCIAVNMIQDSDNIEQNSDKPDITTTTAIRLILDKAANTDEAVELLKQYDMHGSMGMMIHFAISDSEGKSISVEYVNNELVVTDTPVLTNFYISQGEKYGIGTDQSHERFEILRNALAENAAVTEEQLKNILDSVSKDNFNEFESTQWSIVYNQTKGEAKYYHRENYNKVYTFNLAE
ncbi:MAG: C45 family peptidase [Clostridia bacterium]|nr:C45 family peptidase [Clostridia bacterium]